MTTFEIFFFNVFNHYKIRFKKKALKLAVLYITVLQSSLMLLLGAFFAAFFSQLNVNTMSSDKAWILFVMASLLIYFNNWIQYSGRKRSVMNAKLSKRKTKYYNIRLLWLLPICFIALSVILLKVL